jgi:hypothetical protein
MRTAARARQSRAKLVEENAGGDGDVERFDRLGQGKANEV